MPVQLRPIAFAIAAFLLAIPTADRESRRAQQLNQ
jgi:hypothetical protein